MSLFRDEQSKHRTPLSNTMHKQDTTTDAKRE